MSSYYLQRIDRQHKPPSGTLVRQDGHWSASGLLLCHAYTMPSSTHARSEILISNLYHGVITGPTYLGNALSIADNTTHRVVSACPHPTNNFTIAITFKFNTTPAGGVLYSPDDSNLGAMCPEVFLSSGKVAFCRLAKDTTTYGWVESPYSVCDGKLHTVVVTVSGGAHVMYIDGIRRASTSGNTTPFVGSNIMYGCKKGSSGLYVGSMGGQMHSVYVYNRVLSSEEAYLLSVNPWIIFEPELLFDYRVQSTQWDSVGGYVAGGSSRFFAPPIIRPSGGLVAGGMSPLGMLYNGNTKVVRTDNDYSFTMSNTTKRFTMKEV